MNNVDQLQGTPFQEGSNKKALPGSINILTILTFIGCGISLLTGLWNFANARKGLETLEKLQESGDMDKAPGFLKNMMGPEALEMARIGYENRVPIFIITLVALSLCVYGALQMRSLKKQGYYLWLIGEILPIIGGIIFIGMGMLSGFGLITLIIPAVFIILYSTQLKYLR